MQEHRPVELGNFVNIFPAEKNRIFFLHECARRKYNK
jgi:hypothetical protein